MSAGMGPARSFFERSRRVSECRSPGLMTAGSEPRRALAESLSSLMLTLTPAPARLPGPLPALPLSELMLLLPQSYLEDCINDLQW